MSTPNSLGQTLRRTFTRTRTVESKSESSSSSDNHQQGTPRMKTGKALQNAVPPMEQDGSLFPTSARNVAGSDDSGEETSLPASWVQKFDDAVRACDALSAKARAKRAATATEQVIDLPEDHPASVAGKKSDEPPSSEPRLQRTNRSVSFMAPFLVNTPRLSNASPKTDTVQSLTLGDLAKSRWVVRGVVKHDQEGFPVLEKIPEKFRRALADTYQEFSGKITHQGLNSEDREEQLKQVLAKKFLALALLGPDSTFDKSKIGSRTEINQYLSKTFGVQIDLTLAPTQEVPGSPRSPRNRSFSSFSSSSAWPPASDDFRDLLVQDAVHRSRNHHVEWSIDLGDIDTDPFIRKTYDDTIEKTKSHEVVSKSPNARTDVTATFQRDFPKSKYVCQLDNGSVVDFKSIDEFVAFIGDPKKSGLPKKVSHYACQNLGMFIKNLLFTRTDGKGNPQSVLQLFDGTPLAFSISPTARYLVKKAADGSVTLSYRSEIDTKDARKLSKYTASVLYTENGQTGSRAVLIENASAVITLDIVFHPDGTARMGTLKLHAEGWNQLSDW